MKDILRVILSFAVVFAAVALASLFVSPQTSAWYASLAKPDLTPPSILFAPVWIVLYIFMAVALARVWNAKSGVRKRGWFFVFGTQLLLNALWSIFFFTFHALFLSAVGAVVLWFAVVILTLGTWDIDRASFWLLVPCLAWTTFALVFNIAIWWVN